MAPCRRGLLGWCVASTRVGASCDGRGPRGVPEEARPHALETADYWISVGLTIGLERPHQARRLLELIEAEEAERVALAEDAAALLEEALE